MKINITALELLVAQRGMNFSQLAEKAKVSRQTLSTIKGRQSCAATTTCKLANALGVDPQELIDARRCAE